MIIMQSAALCIAFVLDLLLGDPKSVLHPIRLMGALISLLERVFGKIFPASKAGETAAGVFLTAFVVIICGGVPLAILFFSYSRSLLLGMFLETIICYFMLSARSLGRAGMDVYHALVRGDTDNARKNVSMIVGRDTESLDDVGITKAAVETIAENTSDGVVAPLIYMALGGAVLGCVYKAINTMDSMIGYKNDRYINLGKAAAKLDDAVNYIPSRVSACVMIVTSFFLGFDFENAAKIHRRDSRKHASPNSAQTESVVAGALGIQLGGDAYYFGKLYKKPLIGDAIADVKYDHIKQANRMMYATAVFVSVILAAVKLTVGSLL